MTNKQLKNLKDTLWTTADQLRANSGLKSTEYAEPILGLIFLRFADVKYSKFEPEIKAEFDSIKGTRMERPIHEIAIEKCGFYLPEEARYDWLLNLPESEDLAKKVKEAMEAVEKYTAELEDTLPKDIYYSVNSEDDPLVLAKLLKNFKDIPADVELDIFGEIYEYFLGEFALAEGQGGGEFFTPASVVRYMVEVAVMANTVDGLYESLRPDIFKMDFEPAYKDAILYLKGIIDGKIRPEKIEAAQARINELLDQSVITAADARKYTITEAGKELDLSKLDIDELRSQFKKLKNKNLEIVNLRKHIEEKLQKMLRRNTTRIKFAERFRNIIDEYNAGGSQNDDFYEKLLKLMEELRAEEERHIKEDLSEAELELFDLLRKEHLTVDEEKRVKLAAKELYNTLTEKRKELFIVGWQNDPQPKERVKGEIVYILNKFLPESYDREIFLRKSTLVFDHIVDQAMTGYNWVA